MDTNLIRATALQNAIRDRDYNPRWLRKGKFIFKSSNFVEKPFLRVEE